jgi:hypothetical protein
VFYFWIIILQVKTLLKFKDGIKRKNEKHVWLYNCKKIFNEYCKLQHMKNWSVYKNLLVRRHNSFFKSNLLNMLNKKLIIVSTRNHFNLETGQLNLSYNIELFRIMEKFR